MMKRQVVCESQWGRIGIALPESECANLEKPPSHHHCEMKPCTLTVTQLERKWSTGSWGEVTCKKLVPKNVTL